MTNGGQPPIETVQAYPAGQPVRPHRGVMILVFGILGLVCCFIFGIVAWVMGNDDLKEMDAGRKDLRPVQLRLLKRFTGYPCPACGFTRETLSFLQGHTIRAWLYNPLLFSFLGVFTAAVAVRVLFGRGLAIHLSGGEQKAFWAIMAVLFAANWLYVVRCVS